MAFDPNKHLRPMKGGAEYLDVKWRLVWLREDHPNAEIETRALEHEPGKWATFVARVAIPGAGSATGHGSESAGDFRDYYEKAETKALGRALASLGYGTQFVGNELDEGERIVDSPVERPKPPQRKQDDALANFDPRRPQDRPHPTPPAAPAPSGPQPALTPAQFEKLIDNCWLRLEDGATLEALKDTLNTARAHMTEAQRIVARQQLTKIEEAIAERAAPAIAG